MYEGIVARIENLQPIKGADFIVAADVMVSNVVIAHVVTGKDTPVGTLGVYFGADIQLSADYCEKNNLCVKRDSEGNKIAGSGYLDPEKRRITTQRFKGMKSEGLWMPIDTVSGTYFEGDKIGEPVAKRYPKIFQTEAKRYPKIVQTEAKQARVKNSFMDRFERWITNRYHAEFPLHYDTDQLLHNLRTLEIIPVGTKFWITEKLHGTSHRMGYVDAPNNLTRWQKIVNFIARKLFGNVPHVEHSYQYVHGSRRVTLDKNSSGYYGSNQFRYDTVGSPNLNKGEIVYGEIVGYVDSSPIMNPHDTTPVKEIKKAYGDRMVYDYGQDVGTAEFYVYRITQFDGLTHQELPFDAMIERAKELGYKTVPVLYSGEFLDVDTTVNVCNRYAQNDGIYSESVLGNHISEGIVIRFENDFVFKHKGYGFKVLEGILKVVDSEDVV